MQARLYPFAIGIPMLILALVQVILDLKGYKPKETADGTPLDFQFTKAIEPAVGNCLRMRILLTSPERKRGDSGIENPRACAWG